jgi:hypothetical protein
MSKEEPETSLAYRINNLIMIVDLETNIMTTVIRKK